MLQKPFAPKSIGIVCAGVSRFSESANKRSSTLLARGAHILNEAFVPFTVTPSFSEEFFISAAAFEPNQLSTNELSRLTEIVSLPTVNV